MYVYNNVNLYIPCCNFIIKRLLHNRLYFLLLLFAFSLGLRGLRRSVVSVWIGTFVVFPMKRRKRKSRIREVTGVHNTMCSTWI